jgi:hypothetical protein
MNMNPDTQWGAGRGHGREMRRVQLRGDAVGVRHGARAVGLDDQPHAGRARISAGSGALHLVDIRADIDTAGSDPGAH